jgi:hypothetical protein
MRKTILAVAAALLASPVAAATVGSFDPSSLVNRDFTAPLTLDGAQWNFGVTIDGHPDERRFRRANPGVDGGHSTVRLIGSDDCDDVAEAEECLVGTIRYTNRVNVGTGPGTDEATATFVDDVWGFIVEFTIDIDRSTNRPRGGCPGGQNSYGCADQWFVNFTSPLDGFRVVGSGGFVHEEDAANIRIYWLRPGTDTEIEVVPLPASLWLLGAGVAGLAVAKRRRKG